MSTRFPSLCPLPRPCQRLSRYPRRCSHPPQSRRSLVRNLRQSRRHNLPSCRQRANAPRVLHQCSAKPRPVHPQVCATNPWGALAVDRPGHPQPQPRQARKHLSLLPLPRERVLGHCLPMAICQWRQARVASGKGRGLGPGGRVPVRGRALAAVQGREEAADRAMGQGAAVAPQPVP